MKIFKRIPTLMAILMPVFLFSVGFSSWTIFGPLNPVETHGSFEAYEVNEYLSWASTDMFEYTSLYFIEDNRADTDGDGKPDYELDTANVGKIVVTYNFTELAETQAKTEAGLNITFTLKCENLNPLTDGNFFTTEKVTVNSEEVFKTQAIISSGSTVVATYSPTAAGSEFAFTHNFKDDNLPSSLTITYLFTNTVGKGFRDDFGQYLLNNKDGVTTTFVTTAVGEVTE